MGKLAARAVGLVLLWGAVWAVPGAVIELLANLGMRPSFASNVDMWPQTLGLAGLVAGVLFCGIAVGAGRLRELEAASGGLLTGLGLVVGLLMAGIVATGVVGGEESWGTYAFVVVMSVLSAIVSGVALRWLARRNGPARATMA